jgi:exodeoxyribonuclease-5
MDRINNMHKIDTVHTADIKLTKEQSGAIQKIKEWLKFPERPYFVLAGSAGTGKTTLLKYLTKTLNHKLLIMAFTGKATSVLVKKGIADAQTIHSTIYNYDRKYKKFTLKSKKQITDHADMIIIDEASMISDQLLSDLFHFRLPILFVGDNKQLPPINSKLNLLDTPDYLLKTIHRQAKDSPIIKASYDVYNGEFIYNQDYIDNKRLLVSNKDNCSPLTLYKHFNQIICGYNSTRNSLNKIIRQGLGKDSSIISEGERLICLRNSRENILLRNGKIFIVNQILGSKVMYDSLNVYSVELIDEFDNTKVQVNITFQSINKEINNKLFFDSIEVLEFDYGYVITCHKSQGSEWEKVAVYNEPFGDDLDSRRWSYTAFTRASERLIIVY